MVARFHIGHVCADWASMRPLGSDRSLYHFILLFICWSVSPRPAGTAIRLQQDEVRSSSSVPYLPSRSILAQLLCWASMRGRGIYVSPGSDQSDFEPGPKPSRSILPPRASRAERTAL